MAIPVLRRKLKRGLGQMGGHVGGTTLRICCVRVWNGEEGFLGTEELCRALVREGQREGED